MKFLAIGVSVLFWSSLVFAAPEGKVLQPSPIGVLEYAFPANSRISDYAVSVRWNEVLALVNQDESSRLELIELTADAFRLKQKYPWPNKPMAVVSHPDKDGLWFVLSSTAKDQGPWSIWRVSIERGTFTKKEIFTSTTPLRRLVVSPRPFSPDGFKTEYQRLLFASKTREKVWQIHSIDENGGRLAQVTLPRPPRSRYLCPPSITPEEAEEGEGCTEHPSLIVEPEGALPLSFHPDGIHFNYETSDGCRRSAQAELHWSGMNVPKGKCETPAFYHPNGAITWSWSKNATGIRVETYPLPDQPKIFFAEHSFLMPPVFLPDGRAAIGYVSSGERVSLRVIPLADPVAQIFNLWRFKLPAPLLQKLISKGGVFAFDQTLGSDYRFFHLIYDDLVYRTTPGARPPIVTTEPFWYVVALAIEVGFTTMERLEALPGYQAFLDRAIGELSRKQHRDEFENDWLEVFKTARVLLDAPSPDGLSGDARLCHTAKEKTFSEILRKDFDSGECLPRSHYAADPVLARYWRSFKYLTSGSSWNKNGPVRFESSLLAHFPTFSEATMKAAQSWVKPYAAWMAPSTYTALSSSKSKELWKPSHPFRNCGLSEGVVASSLNLFPAGWGWDDELNCRITEAQKKNSSLEEWLLAFSGGGEIETIFPVLEKELPWKEWATATQSYFKKQEDSGLYRYYLEGIRTDLNGFAPNGIFQRIDPVFLKVKSALSAAGAWAHLKHTMQLVSEESAAEGGQGGPTPFENVRPERPPAAVEPRPDVFLAQKRILDQAIELIRPLVKPGQDEQQIIEQMARVSSTLLVFAQAATLQKQGKMLPPDMDNKAHEIARIFDHADVFFNGFLNAGAAVARAKDDSHMGIVASVGNWDGTKRYVGTGKPLIAHFVIEEGGKHRVVVGAAFSVYSTESPKFLSDRDWQKTVLPQTHLPSWVEEFVAK